MCPPLNVFYNNLAKKWRNNQNQQTMKRRRGLIFSITIMDSWIDFWHNGWKKKTKNVGDLARRAMMMYTYKTKKKKAKLYHTQILHIKYCCIVCIPLWFFFSQKKGGTEQTNEPKKSRMKKRMIDRSSVLLWTIHGFFFASWPSSTGKKRWCEW